MTTQTSDTKQSDWADLPTRQFREEICAQVDTSQVTIVTAETGAGKSTQVPQYLAEHGYDRVIVTQPRILAARNLSRRVREEWALRNNEDSSDLVGYRTAHERDDSGQTKILYCTDGLQLVREITGIGTKSRQVLVLDEVHEWNENMEVLVAWAKKRCQEEPGFKVVIMSATIETASLAQYFDTEAVISVPGRYYEVTKSKASSMLNQVLKRLQGPASNMLVFLPGKAEIQDMSDAIAKAAQEAGSIVIPLHSQLEASAQQAAFESYPGGKVILATNIAQTSVTIDDINVVIDSGLERRSEVRQGVEGLFIAQISQADCLQRAGRAGRTQPGEYVLAPFDNMPCLDFEDRPEYATPEILRKHIDRLTLRLAAISIDIESLDFYHDPSRKAITRAKRTLVALGALTKSGEVTRIGRAMERFPVSSSYARMLVEAADFSKSVQRKLAAIIAIQEIGGIVKGGTSYTGWRKYVHQSKSDLLAQYEVYLALPDIAEDDYEELGIIGKNVAKAEEVMQRLQHDLGLDDEPLTPVDSQELTPLLRSIVAGQVDQIWMAQGEEAVHIQTKRRREISTSSVVKASQLIVGTPFDLQISSHKGDLETLHLLQGITAVNTDWLIELAPDLFKNMRTKVVYDPGMRGLVKRQRVRFGKQILFGDGHIMTDDTPQNRRAFRDAFANWAFDKLQKQSRSQNRFSRRRQPPAVSVEELRQRVQQIADGAVHVDQLDKKRRAQLLALADPRSYESPRQKKRGYQPKPGSRRKGWKPSHKRKFNRKRD